MCLIKSLIHKNNWEKPFIAKNNIFVYKALDASNFDSVRTPFRCFPIIFDNGKCVMNEPRMNIYGGLVNRGIHAFTIEEKCKKFSECYGTKKFWAVIPKGSKYFVGNGDEIVSDKLIIFKSREEFRKYKKEFKCINLNLELSK